MLGDGGDGVFIRPVIFQRVCVRVRGLAQHVEGKGVALAGVFRAALHRLADGLAEDEMLAHDPHGLPHGGADHRLAEAVEHVLGGGGDAAQGVFRLHVVEPRGGQHQRAGGEIHQRKRALAFMGGPVAGLDLVLDKGVRSGRVGGSEECFGEAHQRHPLPGGEAVFLKKLVDQAGALGVRARHADEFRRFFPRPSAQLPVCRGGVEKDRRKGVLPHEIVIADGLAHGVQRSGCRHDAPFKIHSGRSTA